MSNLSIPTQEELARVLSGERDDTVPVHLGYTEKALHDAFERVSPKSGPGTAWKNPIDRRVSTDGLTPQQVVELELVISAAIGFYAGGQASFNLDAEAGCLHVTAPGYYALIGA